MLSSKLACNLENRVLTDEKIRDQLLELQMFVMEIQAVICLNRENSFNYLAQIDLPFKDIRSVE